MTINMEDNQLVNVWLGEDNEGPYLGVVIRASKMWVEIQINGKPFIADENTISRWEPA